ncbi:MAG: glycosyltransferase [Chloroflexi bacterium]|nr:glycosyltransferase [Chloroflexota bacterium]
MKVLLLTQVLPYPPDSGPKVKTLNVLKYLARHHEVTLVSFVRGDQSADVKQLDRYCRAIHTVPMERAAIHDALAMARSLLTGQPWMMVRDDRAAMRQLVDRLSAETRFDIAHADQLNMAQYAERVKGARKILDAHNALWLLYKRLWQTMGNGLRKILLGRDWQLIKKYEGRTCRDFDAVLAVSDEDKAALEEAMGRRGGITVIPIAVDTDELAPVNRLPDADHILHIGTMYWPPNIDGILWFIRDIYSRIRAGRPGVEFDVVGARPPQEIVELGKNGSGINVTGYVDDPTPYLQKAGAMVVPLRSGGGMRVKILNALSQGLPIVTTTLGCEGIAVEPGKHVLVADTPEAFAQATLRLLEDKALAAELGRNGRQLIQSTYDYRAACRPLDAVYQGSKERK